MMVNMNDGGNVPMCSSKELQQIGYQIANWPSFLALASIYTLKKTLSVLLESGSSESPEVPLADFAEFSDLIGFDEIRKFSERWVDK